MIKTVRRLKVRIPTDNKNKYPESLQRGGKYEVIAEKVILRRKKDKEKSEEWEDLVFGVINDGGYLVWISAFLVEIEIDA